MMRHERNADSTLLQTPTLNGHMPPALVLWRYAGLTCVRARIESGALSHEEGAIAETCFRTLRVPTEHEVRRWFPNACSEVETRYGSFTAQHLLAYFRYDHLSIEPTPTWVGTTLKEVLGTRMWMLTPKEKGVYRAFNVWDIPLTRGISVVVHATHIVEVLPERY